MKTSQSSVVTAIAAAVAALFGYMTPAAAAPRSPVELVHPGQRIQTAIDAARPGSTVIVTQGRYRENLVITKPITLRGLGDVLLLPARQIAANACTNDPDAPPGFDVGICIHGKLGATPPGQDVPTVLSPVPDVRVFGLRVVRFTGGIVSLGTRNLHIEGVDVAQGGDGIFVEQGTLTTLIGNKTHHNNGAGLQLRGSSKLRVEDNRSFANRGEGLTVLDSHEGTVRDNILSGNCAGMAVIDTAAPGIAGDLRVVDNTVHANDLLCQGDSTKPSESGVGIGLIGTTRVTLTRNAITDNVGVTDPQSGEAATFGGIGVALLDAGRLTGGPAPSYNRVTRNHITGNQPLDVLYDGSGPHNAFTANTCDRANVAGICT